MSRKMFLVCVCALFVVFTAAQFMAQSIPGQGAASQAASQAGNATSQAGQAAAQAGKDAASQTGNAASKAGDAASQATDAASQTGKDASDAASQAGKDASQTGKDAAQLPQSDAGPSVDPATKSKVEAKLQQMSSELNLTDDQKTQIKPVLQDEVSQLKGVKDDSSMSPAQKKAKAKEIHESAKSQINSFLTPDQQKKLAEMRESARENYK